MLLHVRRVRVDSFSCIMQRTVTEGWGPRTRNVLSDSMVSDAQMLHSMSACQVSVLRANTFKGLKLSLI